MLVGCGEAQALLPSSQPVPLIMATPAPDGGSRQVAPRATVTSFPGVALAPLPEMLETTPHTHHETLVTITQVTEHTSCTIC